MSGLKQFVNAVNRRLFSDDVGFEEQIRHQLSGQADALTGVLKKWETHLPRWEALATEASRPEKLPRVEKYDRVGNRVERIVLPLETRVFRRDVVEQGIFTGKTEFEKFTKIYLLAQLGESGVTCPLACTDGLQRVIATLGDDFLKTEYFPKLISADYPLAGAQFVTEITGGSDVGAIEGRASPRADGTWSINAEKWYCSATDEFFLVLARPDGRPAGTEGLAIFFVPRVVAVNGEPSVNALSIRRLKNKLGTQSLPTAEIDFLGSQAWLIGKVEDGFHNLMTYILNISRIHNAANSLGFHRRAFAEARNYATQRVAFGNPIIRYPLIQETLVGIQASLSARRGLYLQLLNRLDTLGLLPENRDERLWQRFLINLLKYRTAGDLTEQVKQAITVLGANGIIEDFSIVPRLLRDALIVETWEGPHNTLCLQIMRDSTRYEHWKRLETEIEKILQAWPPEVIPQARGLYLKAIDEGKVQLTPQHLQDPAWVATHARRLVDWMGELLEIGTLVTQGVAQQNGRVLALASYLTHKKWGPTFSNPVVADLGRMGLDLIHEKTVEGSDRW